MPYNWIFGFLILITIIAYAIGKYKSSTSKKAHEEMKVKLDQITELESKLIESLERTKKISKNVESIALYNEWYSEFEKTEETVQRMRELDIEAIAKLHEKRFEKFKEIQDKFNLIYEQVEKVLVALLDKMENFTGYELENTQIALKIKQQIKELQHDFNLNLQVLDTFEPKFKEAMSELIAKLSNFEDVQKFGDYKTAREILRETSEDVGQAEFNYNVILELFAYVNEIEHNINIVNQVDVEITKMNFALDIPNLESVLNNAVNVNEGLKAEILKFDFKMDLENENLEAKEKKLVEIDESIEDLKTTIEKQFEVIVKIDFLLTENEKLIGMTTELIAGAVAEKEEITNLYQVPSMPQIDKLEKEVEIFSKFREDYAVLHDVIFNQKENYDQSLKRVEQSYAYLSKLLMNLEKAVTNLKDIRTDELIARETIEDKFKGLYQIELYLRSNDHYYEQSDNLKAMYAEAKEKLDKLVVLLNATPLEITEVRKLDTAVGKLIIEIIHVVETEIKLRLGAEKLIIYSNRFIDVPNSQTIIMMANNLYNNRDYKAVIRELNTFLVKTIPNGDDIYKNLVQKISIKTFDEYFKEVDAIS